MSVQCIKQGNGLIVRALTPAARNFSSSITRLAQVKQGIEPFPVKHAADIFVQPNAAAVHEVEIAFDPKEYQKYGIGYVVAALANAGKHFSQEQYENLRKLIDQQLKSKR
ncbi:MAG: hypothetical protein K0Q50_919 [Vampirovibrio sp.]|jgi:hypothetical protein|nr:hypothetical protein [Vampirovibrio sp.]